MADELKQIKEFPLKSDFGDDDLLLIQGQGTTYSVKGTSVKAYAEDAAKPQVELAAQQAQAAAEAADRAEDAIQHPAIPDSNTGNWLVWDQVSESYQQHEPPLRAEGQDFEIKGYYPTLAALQAAVPNPEKGYAYGVGTEAPYDIYVWDMVNQVWRNNGPMTASGDMLRSVYDPQNKHQDVFAYAESVGLPAGGTVGQIPSITSAEPRVVEWQDPPEGGVTSFKGRTGAVTPASGDYSVGQVTGAAPKASPVFSGNISLGRKTGTNAGFYSIAVGEQVEAAGFGCAAFGEHAVAKVSGTLAAGSYCEATGYQSCALGCGTIANQGGMLAIGEANNNGDSGDVFVIGSGTFYFPGSSYQTIRSNCFRVNEIDGTFGKGSYHTSGADYAELFEWADGNPDHADRAGLFVTLDGAKIRLAGPEDDYILGVVSGAPSVVGDVYDDQWWGMYLTDIFGRPIMEDVEVPAVTEEVRGPVEDLAPDGSVTPFSYRVEFKTVIPAHTERRQKLNPAYDNTQPYVPRTERPEWDAVGMLGKLVAVDDGTCQANGWAKVGQGGAATGSVERTKYRVMERLDETHVRLMIL